MKNSTIYLPHAVYLVWEVYSLLHIAVTFLELNPPENSLDLPGR